MVARNMAKRERIVAKDECSSPRGVTIRMRLERSAKRKEKPRQRRARL
jgi:hypothetical protein